ncbi:MAG: hypothetical protein FJ302_18655 [Planctomycetes bacterium]|nr:hypothetical protein [Planctomycetota bacterium]
MPNVGLAEYGNITADEPPAPCDGQVNTKPMGGANRTAGPLLATYKTLKSTTDRIERVSNFSSTPPNSPRWQEFDQRHDLRW